MHFVANHRPPPPPKRERGIPVSWIFFLLVAARPLWGIARALVGPHVTDTQLWLAVAGAVGLAVAVVLISQLARRGRSEPASRLPTAPAPDWRPPARLPLPQQTASTQEPVNSGLPMGPPRYEPIITPRVALAGVVLALLIGAGLLLIGLA